MNKTASIIITVGLVIGIGFMFFGGPSDPRSSTETGQALQNVEVRDGIQYVTIEARGGYTPRVSTAEAGIPTKLIIKTNGTYDCSSALVIRSVNYQKILPPTGEEVVDIGTPVANVPLQGTCSMGMYNFSVDFK